MKAIDLLSKESFLIRLSLEERSAIRAVFELLESIQVDGPTDEGSNSTPVSGNVDNEALATLGLLTPRFKVHVGGTRYRKFNTLEEASKFCDRVFAAQNVVLSIEPLLEPR